MSIKINNVRLETIKIQDFKNVKCGELSFISGKKSNTAEIIGLYGQNGSGKTALIDAMSLLKTLFCGKVIDHRFADYIRVGAENLVLTYTFIIKGDNDEIRSQTCCGVAVCGCRCQRAGL